MQHDTVAESACRSLGGVELSTTAEGKDEARRSVQGQRESGQAGGRAGLAPFPCRAKTVLPPPNRRPGKRAPRPNEADK
jgi:hypothetical protein